MTAVKIDIYVAIARVERALGDAPERAEMMKVHHELERLTRAYDEFGRFAEMNSGIPGYFTDVQHAVRDLARYRTKYERLRVVVRKLNEVIRERRYQKDRQRLGKLMEIAEALMWKLGKREGEAKAFTWIRFDTREEFEEYAAWKRQRGVK